ncbi:hypothetical protein EVAR_76959_1 [Eumeta japonica]|uniref:Uncharacterized protein n=1 Tax=Eumeta variegata TaxID=151549 RepID=A0A4C1SF44_EUMVA|nr:hypothetical protein EVAR_76959_1 [Eumeta japonica]
MQCTNGLRCSGEYFCAPRQCVAVAAPLLVKIRGAKINRIIPAEAFQLNSVDLVLVYIILQIIYINVFLTVSLENAIRTNEHANDQTKSRWSPPPVDSSNFRGITGALPDTWVGIGF